MRRIKVITYRVVVTAATIIHFPWSVLWHGLEDIVFIYQDHAELIKNTLTKQPEENLRVDVSKYI